MAEINKECKGIVRGAFYKKNTCGDTKDLLWGRSQGVNMEIFKYDSSSDGITISKRIAYPQPQKRWIVS